MTRFVAQDVCGALKKDGSLCQQPAGWGTNHYGTGRCKLHSGTLQGTRLQNKYLELKMNPELAAKAEELLADPELVNVERELAMLRVLLWEEILNPLQEEINNDPDAERERRMTYTNSATKMVAKITSVAVMAQRMAMERQHYLPVTVIGELIDSFAQISRRYITDPDKLAEFSDEVKNAIRKNIRAATARNIAASALSPTPDQILNDD